MAERRWSGRWLMNGAFWPMNLAEKLPRGVIRMIGLLCGIVLVLAQMPITFVALAYDTFAEMWEVANR